MRIDATIQARMGSSRLPGKVLARVVDKPLLELQVERIRRSWLIDRVIIATTELAADDAIEELADDIGVLCFRGSVDDVLGRVTSALRTFDVDLHVEFQGDSPLPDSFLIDAMIGCYLKHAGDVDYVTNALKTTFPPGQEVSVYRAATLFEAEKLVDDDSLREHVGIHIYQRPDRFRLHNVEAPAGLRAPDLYLEVDTAADLDVIRRIYEHFYPRDPEFGLRDILEFAVESGLGELNRNEPRRWKKYRQD
jgi:spore coat polysaccharide biosynthesis protein SpsF